MLESFLVLTVPFAFVIIVLWLQINEKHKRYQLQAELYTKALEKGQPIPTDCFPEPKKKRNPLNTGIICIAVGIGIIVFIWLMATSLAHVSEDAMNGEMSRFFLSFASVGVIPFLIGVAYVIIHFIEKKKVVGENAK